MLRGIKLDSNKEISITSEIVDASFPNKVYIPLINVFNRPFGAINYYHGKSGNSNKMLDITNGVGLKEKSARFMADAEIVFYQLRSH